MENDEMNTDSTIAEFPWEWSEHFVSIGSLRIHYWDARRSGAPIGVEADTLVALHGMSSHGDSWRQVVDQLSTFDRVVCPDFRGHGLSDWTQDGYWLSDYATDTVGVVDALGIDRFSLIGHSLGARVAMVLGTRLVGRLNCVVLSDTGPEVSREGALKALAISSETSQSNGFRDEAALRSFLEKENAGYSAEAIETRATKLYRKNWAGRWVHRGDPEVTWLLGKAGLKVGDMWNGLKAYECPALLIHCAQSFLLDEDLVARMSAACPLLSVVTLDADHMVLYKNPDLFRHTLEEFVSGR